MDQEKDLAYIQEETDENDSVFPKGGLKRLKRKLKECQREKKDYLSQAQRARADLINYQKRQERLVQDLSMAGQVKLIADILPVLDSLEQGVKKNKEIGYLKEQLTGVLKNYQLVEIKAKGAKFDPALHEAVDQVNSEEESGTILEEVQKGYLLGDKVLRPSKVRVVK